MRGRVQGRFYDALETRSPDEREAALMIELPRVIAAAKAHAPAYRGLLAKVRPEDVTDRRALVDLPLTRKSDRDAAARAALRRAERGADRQARAGVLVTRSDL